jgi:hypothetical protein
MTMNLHDLSPDEQCIYRIGFLEGQIEGITDYAIWRNGEQLVGCMEKPLCEVIKPFKDEIAKLEETLP